MKVWIKLLIGSILGLILGLVVPQDNTTIMKAIDWLAQVALQIGRYTLVPTLGFSLVIAIYELRQDKHMWPVVFRTVGIIIGSSLFIIGSGMLVTLMFPPARIPILIESQKESISLDIGQGILQLLPSNMLSGLVSDGTYLLPVWIFAIFLGAGFSYDRVYTKPVISFVDSLSRIFYYIAIFFSEILGIFMICLGAFWAVRFQGALKAQVFRDIIVLLAIYGFLLSFVILPLFLYFLGGKRSNPWKQLYGALGPAIAGLFSGDINFTLPLLVRHAKENHGVQRRSNAVSLVLFSTFARAGSAMVAAMSIIVIIKSYSSLGISAGDLFIILLFSAIISALLPRHPGNGAYIALAVLCGWYGKGFEAGYLILKPIAFYLVAIGTMIDAMVASLGTYAVGYLSGFQQEKETRHFI
ncbi:MAG: cation:dicarboxylase symporter family transporter [Treponema sp.]|nr:cation:dicarboxylase symporter family transporter [Treponema sp.]